jgi:nitroreductase
VSVCFSSRVRPSAFNIQNWRFVVLRDPALRQQVRAAAWGQAQVTDASLLMLLAGIGAVCFGATRYIRKKQ